MTTDIRDWLPGDGLTCGYAHRSPIECGLPVKTVTTSYTVAREARPRIKVQVLCALHARGRETGQTPGAIKAEAKRRALQRLAREHWDDYQRFIEEEADLLIAQEPQCPKPGQHSAHFSPA